MGCFTISMHLKLLGFWNISCFDELLLHLEDYKSLPSKHGETFTSSIHIPSIYFTSPPQNKNTWQEICSRIFSSSVFNLPWQIQNPQIDDFIVNWVGLGAHGKFRCPIAQHSLPKDDGTSNSA